MAWRVFTMNKGIQAIKHRWEKYVELKGEECWEIKIIFSLLGWVFLGLSSYFKKKYISWFHWNEEKHDNKFYIKGTAPY